MYGCVQECVWVWVPRESEENEERKSSQIEGMEGDR